MTAELLRRLRKLGFKVSTDGVDLNISGPAEVMTDELRDRIRQSKAELIALVADTMPDRSLLFRRCKDAVTGLAVDPSELCQWLLDQGDPGWCVPAAARRWAEIIQRRGFPS